MSYNLKKIAGKVIWLFLSQAISNEISMALVAEHVLLPTGNLNVYRRVTTDTYKYIILKEYPHLVFFIV